MSRKKILIVEDEVVIRASLKKFLEKKLYKVVEAGSLAEALQNNLQDFALIITDLHYLARSVPISSDTLSTSRCWS